MAEQLFSFFRAESGPEQLIQGSTYHKYVKHWTKKKTSRILIFLAGVPRGDGPRPFLAVEHVRDLLLELVVEEEEQEGVDQA